MAGSEWSVETERLTSAAEEVNTRITKYNQEWQKLYTEVQNLRTRAWEGVASETFNSKLEGYRDDFEQMAKVLTSFVEFLKTAAAKYEKTEEAVKEAAGELNTGAN